MAFDAVRLLLPLEGATDYVAFANNIPPQPSKN
eukprot:CAMPEP_0174338012 /NCGR_PEP_ID=MMETSP0810-20121108/22810_1 /TAXON_ID=73025 ORGANISM="Eutreptiella gymnastica-like, Strain CCMP1594" /NCGR_SAMPLE_ID=MMETSP0810 /ASSEMBLY_ACC=CAM_ASM_000659 /LENGTH=32 /DNA_ID= /DNA_START= /DNA_END= /DNA_ORIENTATION=